MGMTPTPTPPSWDSMLATKLQESVSGLYISTWCKKRFENIFLKNELGYVLYVKLQSAEQWWSDGYRDKKD
jgi:hypothetical protein